MESPFRGSIFKARFKLISFNEVNFQMFCENFVVLYYNSPTNANKLEKIRPLNAIFF